jgi:PAP2 superfamily
MKNCFFALIALPLLLHVSCSKNTIGGDQSISDQRSSQVILDWNKTALEITALNHATHGLLNSRIFAMVHLAQHDAINAIENRFHTYALEERNLKGDPIAAAASAAYEVILAHAPNQKDLLNQRLQASLSQITEGIAKTQGIETGKKAAEAILALRSKDGAAADPISKVETSSTPGVYQPVAPFDFAFAPFWAKMQTFSLEKADQFRVSPMPAINSQAYTQDFNEVKRLGKKGGAERSATQDAIGKYWYEFSEIGWNRIANIVTTEKKLGLFKAARLMALVNMALADSYAAGWDSKVHYNFWRPTTAIRAAANDGNDATSADLQWESAETTPPIMDYPSTHSVLGQAAATVLGSILGDKTNFTMTSGTAQGPAATRSFTSLNEAAQENANSRVYAGLHFRFSCVKGIELGKKIGEWTVQRHLLPTN